MSKSLSVKHRWKIKPGPPTEFFDTVHEVPNLLATLLWQRNISTNDSIREFLEPNYEKHSIDPYLFRHMQKAVDKISDVVDRRQKITIFGDYDADGVCGAAILSEFLKKIRANYGVYIPDRSKESFGLSLDSVKKFHGDGTKLLISIDCGVTDYDEIELANSLGMDVIILDHHIVPPHWPNALAIIDHKHPDETYPEKVLSGAGLTFKLTQALIQSGKFSVTRGWEKWLLDLVAIAAVADMVPLTGENRVFTHFGLKVLRKNRRLGLQKLFLIADKNPVNSDTETISHFIAPRINAASRMDHANTAFALLTTENEEEARWLAERLETKNSERKVVVETILENMERRIESSRLPSVIFEGSSEWPAGVLGLAATRLVERYSRPVFLYSENNEFIKGSCRAPEGINVVELMTKGRELFSDFGGHALSGGFSILPEHLESAKERLENAGKDITNSITTRTIEAALELELSEVGDITYETVKTLEPFGQGNPRPMFLIKNVAVADAKKVGSEGNHLKMRLGERRIGAIFFRAGDNNFSIGDRIDILAELSENIWNNSRNIELRIVSARHAANII